MFKLHIKRDMGCIFKVIFSLFSAGTCLYPTKYGAPKLSYATQTKLTSCSPLES